MPRTDDIVVIDWNGRILTNAQKAELARTETGRKLLHEYVFGARAGYTAHELLSYLDELQILKRALTIEEQQNICGLIYSCIFEHDYSVVEQWIRAAAEWANREGLEPPQFKPRYDC